MEYADAYADLSEYQWFVDLSPLRRQEAAARAAQQSVANSPELTKFQQILVDNGTMDLETAQNWQNRRKEFNEGFSDFTSSIGGAIGNLFSSKTRYKAEQKREREEAIALRQKQQAAAKHKFQTQPSIIERMKANNLSKQQTNPAFFMQNAQTELQKLMSQEQF